MISANERITLRQFQILFLLEAFGTGFIVLPRIAARYAAQDGWLAALLFLILGILFVLMVTGTARHFGSEHFSSYTKRLLSAPIGTVVCLLLWAKILFSAGLELRLFGEIVRGILLIKTPNLAVYIVVLTVAAYAAILGIEARARLAEILIIVIAVPLLILGVVALFNINFSNLMPALVTSPENLVFGVLRLGFIFTGIEFMWLSFPYLNKPKEGRRAAIHAMLFAGIIMVVITAFTLAKFGPLSVQALEWPVLKMMDMITALGSLAARQEAFVMSFWMLSVFAFAAASIFYAAVLGKDMAGQHGKHRTWCVVSAVIAGAVAMLPFSSAQVYWLLDRIFLTLGLGFWALLPIILTTIRIIRKRSFQPIVEADAGRDAK